jgi:hypothetical protein
LACFLRERFAELISGAVSEMRMPNCRRAIILCGAVVLSSHVAAAATFIRRETDQGAEIFLQGDIAREDADSLETLFRRVQEEGSSVQSVRLNSPGGNLLGAIALAKFIRSHAETSTAVDSGSICASACFLAFSAGSQKFANYNAWVGIHGVADGLGKTSDETEAATRAMAHISNEFGVPTEITDKMIATPPADMAWLTPDELRRMGVVMTGKPSLTPKPPSDSAPAETEPGAVGAARDAADRGDFITAVRLWRLMAERGHAASQYNLGEMYYAGQGVAQDYSEAVKWYQRAAEQGIPAAQLNVGVAYALGRGIPRDLEKAYMWLSLAMVGYATEKERAQATQARDLVSTHMTTQEISAAKRLTGGWTRSR